MKQSNILRLYFVIVGVFVGILDGLIDVFIYKVYSPEDFFKPNSFEMYYRTVLFLVVILSGELIIRFKSKADKMKEESDRLFMFGIYDKNKDVRNKLIISYQAALMAIDDQMDTGEALIIIKNSLEEAGIMFDEILPQLESRGNDH